MLVQREAYKGSVTHLLSLFWYGFLPAPTLYITVYISSADIYDDTDIHDYIVFNVVGFLDVTPGGVTCARRSRAHVTPPGVTSKNPHTLYCLR